MSPEELERIRARDAALVPGMPMTQGVMLNAAFAPADRRLLLDEVARLEAEAASRAALLAEVDAEVRALSDRHGRIFMAIEDLPSVHEVAAWGTLLQLFAGGLDSRVPRDNLTITGYLERRSVLELFDESGASIEHIEHIDPQCKPEGCTCWCAVCERHNAARAKGREDEVLEDAATAAREDYYREEHDAKMHRKSERGPIGADHD